MHLAAAILTESDKSGENGWLWPVNIEMVGEGGLPPAVVYRRYRKSRRNQRQLFHAPLPCPLDRCCTGDEKVKISSESWSLVAFLLRACDSSGTEREFLWEFFYIYFLIVRHRDKTFMIARARRKSRWEIFIVVIDSEIYSSLFYIEIKEIVLYPLSLVLQKLNEMDSWSLVDRFGILLRKKRERGRIIILLPIHDR